MGAVWNEPAIDSSGDINTFCRNLERLMEQKFGDRVTIKKGFEVRQVLLDGDRKRIAGVRVRSASSDDDAVLEADKYILGRARLRAASNAAPSPSLHQEMRGRGPQKGEGLNDGWGLYPFIVMMKEPMQCL